MTTITNTLPNFPQVSQLHSPTDDGMPDENASWDCVPASLCAALIYYLGPTDPLTGKRFEPDYLKDAVYGQGYTGAQAASQYVAFCRARGVDLAAYDAGTGGALVARAHSELAAGHPVIVTIPSQWGTAPADPLHPAGSTHVVCFCGYGPAALRAMNPWIAPQPHDGDDGYWAARLCFGQVWTVTRQAGAEVTTVAWTKNADKTGTDAQGHHCGEGFINDLIATGLAQHDGRLSETYVSGAQTFKSFLPLTDGTVLVYDGRSVTHDGALVAAELYRLLTVAQAQPAPAPVPVDPKAQAAENVVDAFGKVLDAVAAYRKL